MIYGQWKERMAIVDEHMISNTNNCLHGYRASFQASYTKQYDIPIIFFSMKILLIAITEAIPCCSMNYYRTEWNIKCKFIMHEM